MSLFGFKTVKFILKRSLRIIFRHAKLSTIEKREKRERRELLDQTSDRKRFKSHSSSFMVWFSLSLSLCLLLLCDVAETAVPLCVSCSWRSISLQDRANFPDLISRRVKAAPFNRGLICTVYIRVCFYISFSASFSPFAWIVFGIKMDMVDTVHWDSGLFILGCNIDSLNVIWVLNIISVFIVKRFKR